MTEYLRGVSKVSVFLESHIKEWSLDSGIRFLHIQVSKNHRRLFQGVWVKVVNESLVVTPGETRVETIHGLVQRVASLPSNGHKEIVVFVKSPVSPTNTSKVRCLFSLWFLCELRVFS